MKIFVRNETEKSPVTFMVLEDKRSRSHGAGINVLRSAPRRRRELNQEHVSFIGKLAPEFFLSLNDLGDIPDKCIRVPVALSENAQHVGDSIDFEREIFLIARFDRAVDEV